MYGQIDKLWFIARYAEEKYTKNGIPITEKELRHSIIMMTHTNDTSILNRYVTSCTLDFDELCHSQFKKNEDGTFTPTPNKPKRPRDIMKGFPQ